LKIITAKKVLKQALGLTRKNYTRLKMLAKEKQTL
jgi:hypothetical protein